MDSSIITTVITSSILAWIVVTIIRVGRKPKSKVSRNSLEGIRAEKKFSISFTLHERSQREYPISVGEVVTIWQKPGTNQFNVYHKDSVAGSGYLGHFKSRTLVSIYPGTEYKLKARIKDIYEKTDKWDDTTVFCEKQLIVTKL